MSKGLEASIGLDPILRHNVLEAWKTYAEELGLAPERGEVLRDFLMERDAPIPWIPPGSFLAGNEVLFLGQNVPPRWPLCSPMLQLSTAHMPDQHALNGLLGVRITDTEYGYIVWLGEDQGTDPEWFAKIRSFCETHGISGIEFDQDNPEWPELFEVYKW